MFLKIVVSMLTGIGGHYLNHRWDRAVLFFSLFALCWIVGIVYYSYSLFGLAGSPRDFEQGLNGATQFLILYTSISTFVLWFLSLIITAVDSPRKDDAHRIVKWSKSGIFAALLTTVFSTVLLAGAGTGLFTLYKEYVVDKNFASIRITPPTHESAHKIDPAHFPSNNFFSYLYLGGAPSDSHKLPAPPEGDAMLRGVFLYKNAPINGVSLDIVLNAKYLVKDAVTDENGIFEVGLPPGDWTINSIRTRSWKNKPEEAEFSLYYGGEEKLVNGDFNRHGDFPKNGYPVHITADTQKIHINITISKDIQLVWPKAAKKPVAASMNDTIRWEAYPGAAHYYFEISKITREGNTIYFDKVTSKVLSNETSVPLTSIKHGITSKEEKTEYGVSLYAFADDGTLIGQFRDGFNSGNFLLSDGNILIEDELDDLYNLSSIKDPDEFLKTSEAISLNQKRAKAVSLLIDENMLVEAKALADRMDSAYSQGEKEVLTGYVLSLQGECEKSKAMFEKATTINSGVCIPDVYRKNCQQK